MRNFSSSFVPWIGIILASIAWCGCHAYPDGGAYRNFDHSMDLESPVKSNQDYSTSDLPKWHLIENTPVYDIRRPTKRQVSIIVKDLKTIIFQENRDTSSISNNSTQK